MADRMTYGATLLLQRKQGGTLMLIPVILMTMMMMTKLIASFIEVSTFDLFNRSFYSEVKAVILFAVSFLGPVYGRVSVSPTLSLI
jgi:hypothetical protein